jgi:hypothetical protein
MLFWTCTTASAGTVTVKLAELVPVPAGVVTLIGPLVAPLGTVAVIWVSEFTVNVAAVPLKATFVAPVNPEPLIATEVPTGPFVGENELIFGATVPVVTVKLVELAAVPPGVVTLIGPLVAPLGTVAVIWVFEFTVNAAVVPLKATFVAPVNPEPLIATDVPTCPLVGE